MYLTFKVLFEQFDVEEYNLSRDNVNKSLFIWVTLVGYTY